MRKKRKRQILINIEERQLVLYSEVINQYPKLKQVLQKYANIYEKDIANDEGFDDDLRNVILHVFRRIKEEAEKEWRGTGDVVIEDPPNPNDRIQCSLCGRRNKYIFYIVNRFNDTKLNVGSDCILKFPGIDNRLPEGMTLKQVKNRAVRGYNKLKRLELFNQKFPDAENMISNWKTEYEHLPIILPTNLHNNITSIHAQASQIFERYLTGKGLDVNLNKFEELISKRNSLMLEAEEFININNNNRFVLTKELYDWILSDPNYKAKLIKSIRDNSSTLDKDSISFIYEDNFMGNVLEDFKKMLVNTKISIEKTEDENIYFKFTDRIARFECELYLSKKELMKSFGSKLFDKNPLIRELEIISKLKFVVNRTNYSTINEELEKLLNGSNFDVKLDTDDLRYGLTFTNIVENSFADQLNPIVFFEAHKDNILIKNKDACNKICKVISSISKWKPLSDKEKFDIGDISKKPETSQI